MAMPAPKPKALLADKGYDGDDLRVYLLMFYILPIIPPKPNKPPRPCPLRLPAISRPQPYRAHVRCHENQRRIATRYDKTALSFASFLNLAAVRLWLQPFVKTA